MILICSRKTGGALIRRKFSRTFHCRLSVSALVSSSKAARHDDVDVAKLLDRPTWSVASLTSADPSGLEGDSEITLEKLRLLLKLSALPFPTSTEKQAAKLKALRTQLHFVRDIQTFETTGVTPLQAIRDESQSAIKAQTIGIKEVEQTLLQEESTGHNRRPRRRKAKATASDLEKWNVLDTASQKAGSYIVVNDAKY